MRSNFAYNIDYGSYQKMLNNYASEYKNQVRTLNKNLNKIKEHKSTISLNYKDHVKPFDYVDILYPKANVQNANVYQCSSSYLSKIGYKGVGGFFERINQTIIIGSDLDFNDKSEFDIITDISVDEILVHELLHYAYFAIGCCTTSLELSEEFAYGNSINYLRQNGRTDEDIINKNFMPFLVMTLDKGRIYKDVLSESDYSWQLYCGFSDNKKKNIYDKLKNRFKEKIVKLAREKGKILIEAYRDEGHFIVEPIREENSFKFLDI